MRQIPYITKNLLIINILFYLATTVLALRGIDLQSLLGLHYYAAEDFRVYQLFTYMFMHGGLMHLFFNMFALWMFGGLIERTFGQRRYIIYYIACGLGAAVCQEVSQFFQLYSMLSEQGATMHDLLNLGLADRMALNNFGLTVGASGCIYGVLLAFGMSYPEEKMFVFPIPFPIKARWFVLGYAAIELWFALSNARGSNDGIAHVAHLGGMLVGYLMIKGWQMTSGGMYGGYDGYEIKPSLMERLKAWLEKEKGKRKKENSAGANKGGWTSTSTGGQSNKAKDPEVEKILEKIRRSGYESLTEEEKKRLF